MSIDLIGKIIEVYVDTMLAKTKKMSSTLMLRTKS